MRTYRPRLLLWWVIGFSILLVGSAVFGWIALGEAVRERFTLMQLSTLLLMMGFLIAVMFGLALSSVRIDQVGMQVRNVVVTHKWTWQQIDGIRYREGDPWASALFRTEDGDIVRRQLIGIQRTDGARAQEAVAELRARLEASRRD